jgi:SAM-dependent methyltransferase
MIDHDNLADYEDPILYDLENKDNPQGRHFYTTLAQKYGNSVLELGCGTGRFTIPMAEQGVDVTGLDIMPGMLARARQKAGDLPIHWVEADARDFHLNRQFAFICETGNMFQHLLTRADQEAMFACVHEHLAENGRFIITATFTRPQLMTTNPTELLYLCQKSRDA